MMTHETMQPTTAAGPQNVTYLSIRWSVSHGYGTEGWNICTLRTQDGKRYSTKGGGYDMLGTVVGIWLGAKYQDRLFSLRGLAQTTYKHNAAAHADKDYLTGLTLDADHAEMWVDGACGIECVMHIAKRIGLELRATLDRQGHPSGYIVVDTQQPHAVDCA